MTTPAELQAIRERDAEWEWDFGGPFDALQVRGIRELVWPREWAIIDRRTLLALYAAQSDEVRRLREALKEQREFLASLHTTYRHDGRLAARVKAHMGGIDTALGSAP